LVTTQVAGSFNVYFTRESESDKTGEMTQQLRSAVPPRNLTHEVLLIEVIAHRRTSYDLVSRGLQA